MSDETEAAVTGEVVRYSAAPEEYRPRIMLAPEEAKALDDALRANMKAILREGVDYGVIPGTGSKPSLLKPGAEKLLQWFGFGHAMNRSETERDAGGTWQGVTYRCTVTKAMPDGRTVTVAECEGCAGYDEDRFYTTAEQAEAKERAVAARYDRSPNKAKFAEYRAPRNSVIKMCLAASTPLLVKSPAGEYLTEATRLCSWLSKPTAPEVMVPGPDGEWVPVSGMFRNGVQPVLRITLRDGTEHRVTAAHRFLTSRGLVAAGDLVIGDRLTRRTIPLAGMKEPDPDFGWLAGLVIADGHVTKWGVRITLGIDEEGIAQRAVWIGRRLGCPARSERRRDMQALLVTITGPAISGLLNQFIAGKHSDDKHLRATAWRPGSEFLDGVLRGWLDGDGSWTERPGRKGFWRVGFTGRNNCWLRDLRVLGAILGYRVSVRTGTSKAGGKTFGTFVGEVKLPAGTHGNNADPAQVMLVEPDGETMTYDLEVGTSDHLYLLHDGTVTHNSQKRAMVGAALQATSASSLFTQDMEDTVTPAPAAALAEAARQALFNVPAGARKAFAKWYRDQGWGEPQTWDQERWCAGLIEAGRIAATEAASQGTHASTPAGPVQGEEAAPAQPAEAPVSEAQAIRATPDDDPWYSTPPVPLALDGEWLARAVTRATTFTTQDEAGELWRQGRERQKDGRITAADASQIADMIKARHAELKAAPAIEGVVVQTPPADDPMAAWRDKVADILTAEDADAALADLEVTRKGGSLDGRQYADIKGAIRTKAGSLQVGATA